MKPRYQIGDTVKLNKQEMRKLDESLKNESFNDLPETFTIVGYNINTQPGEEDECYYLSGIDAEFVPRLIERVVW